MRKIILSFFVLFIFVSDARAQTTEFTFQGSLKTGGTAASGNHDFEFALFDALTGGAQIGATIVLNNVSVTNSVFSVKLNFGNQFQTGANRFLEIRVRQSGQGGITVLAPRQLINSAPYAVKSLSADNAANAANATNALNAVNATNAQNALQLGGVAANQYVLTADSRLSDARNPLPNSPNYIQNTTAQQSSSNFNVSGDGTVGGTLNGDIVNAATQFNLGGNRILSNAGSENLFAGAGAGVNNTVGIENSFFGRFAGQSNNTGGGNSFFGYIAGRFTTSGTYNSFFGSRVGFNNSTGSFNSFFGHRAGENNNGNVNSFFGTGAGLFNYSGNSNTFLGHDAGNTNISGSFNTALGENSDVGGNNLTNATALGSKAFVTQNNSLVLGSINGVNSATADTLVGIGTTAPMAKFHLSGVNVVRARINSDSNGGISLALNEQSNWSLANVSPGHFNIFNDRIGQLALWVSTFDNSTNVGALNVGGITTITSLGNAGATALCRNASNQVSICSSSLRYKQNISDYRPGLSLISRLRPVSFNWKADDQADFGLAAEEVAAVEPLLVTRNSSGEVEGIKYDRLGVVLVNAVGEQQSQIETQAVRINEQNELIKKQAAEIEILKAKVAELDALKQLVCAQNPTTDVCRKKEEK